MTKETSRVSTSCSAEAFSVVASAWVLREVCLQRQRLPPADALVGVAHVGGSHYVRHELHNESKKKRKKQSLLAASRLALCAVNSAASKRGKLFFFFFSHFVDDGLEFLFVLLFEMQVDVGRRLKQLPA